MPEYIIPNLRNACRLLCFVGQAEESYNVTQLANLLNLPKTTVLRIVSTLEAEDFLAKEGNRFSLGSALVTLGMQFSNTADLKKIAKPLLGSLTLETEETSHLAVWDEGRALIMEVSICAHPLSAASTIGTRAFAHCSATGKILMAHCFSDQLSDVWPREERVRRTSKTITDIETMEKKLATIRRVGYAIDDEEYFAGVRCIAAPVRDASGNVCAAMGITASASRFTRKRIPEFAEQVKKYAAKASLQLGYRDVES